jgi:hypothetical protein
VVRRPFPSVEFSLADTFLLLDHMGAVEYAPGEARAAVGEVDGERVGELGYTRTAGLNPRG